MNETDKTSEILASLSRYIEKQEKLLEEENEALLEQAKREFQAATAERIMLFGKRGDTPVAEASQGRLKGLLSAVLLRGRKALRVLSRVLHRKKANATGHYKHAGIG
jgi:hypothetical protein